MNLLTKLIQQQVLSPQEEAVIRSPELGLEVANQLSALIRYQPQLLPPLYRTDQQLAQLLLRADASLIKYLEPALTKQASLVREACLREPYFYGYLPVELRQDKAFLLDILAHQSKLRFHQARQILESLPNNLQADRVVIIALLRKQGQLLLLLGPLALADKELALLALLTHPQLYRILSPDLKLDSEVVWQALTGRPSLWFSLTATQRTLALALRLVTNRPQLINQQQLDPWTTNPTLVLTALNLLPDSQVQRYLLDTSKERSPELEAELILSGYLSYHLAAYTTQTLVQQRQQQLIKRQFNLKVDLAYLDLTIVCSN